MTTLFEMVKEVLDDSREKLAEEHEARSEGETPFKKNAKPPKKEEEAEAKEDAKEDASEEEAEKVAQWCDYLADNLHTVVDDRSPHEKLAEYTAIQEFILKQAEGDLDGGVNPGGPNSAMKTEAADASGTSLDAGESGQATAEKISPKSVEPSEKTTDAGAATALETNAEDSPADTAKVATVQYLYSKGYLTKEAAEDILQKEALLNLGTVTGAMAAPSGRKLEGAGWGTAGGLGGGAAGGLGGAAAGAGLGGALGSIGGLRGAAAGALGGGVLGGLGGMTAGSLYGGKALSEHMNRPERLKRLARGGSVSAAEGLESQARAKELTKKHASVRQEQLAQALINKFAADAENPASISAGEAPQLQSAAGANSAQMQGTEAGEQVPNEKGSDAGRELLSSNESAQNATKRQAKTRTVKSDMGGLLSEPAMSASHDQVLNKSLENASSAGVKIAATRELLKQWAESSPENKSKLAYAIKLAQPPMAPPGAAPMGAPPAGPPPGPPSGDPGVPPPGAAPEVAMGQPPVSDEALAAAAEGVTPTEVAEAQAILAQQGAPAAAAEGAPIPPGAEGAPPA